MNNKVYQILNGGCRFCEYCEVGIPTCHHPEKDNSLPGNFKVPPDCPLDNPPRDEYVEVG